EQAELALVLDACASWITVMDVADDERLLLVRWRRFTILANKESALDDNDAMVATILVGGDGQPGFHTGGVDGDLHSWPSPLICTEPPLIRLTPDERLRRYLPRSRILPARVSVMLASPQRRTISRSAVNTSCSPSRSTPTTAWGGSRRASCPADR